MTFSKFVCWKSEMVEQVMNVEATHPPTHLFLATHHPIPMYREDLTEHTSKIKYTEEDFLKDFLTPSDFVFVTVYGTHGTGKSHLIRWLYITLKKLKKDDQSCRVLLIPRVGTNLKSIIESILEGMVGQEFDEYRLRLSSSSNSLTKEEACKQLLANLAIAVGRSEEKHLLKEGYADIIEGLPALLDDPYFKREYWLKENSIISRLVDHTLGRQDAVENIKERREFAISDLPQSFREIQNASKEAREFYRNFVGIDEAEREVVRWLNLHLDEAIAKVLNLGREDLQRLMLDVRRSLAKQGIELILLIEDFAKLQGIDREVLESVLARPHQATGEPLCAMRTALACTTDYFKGLRDTVKSRTNFNFNLDIDSIGNKSLVKYEDIHNLVAKYLNATRLGGEVIQEWIDSFDSEAHYLSEPLVSACSECQHMSSCHEGFGHVEGIGLYPFTKIAIERMYKRVDKGVFNPRLLIKEVLKYTLEYHRTEIEQGIFPSLLFHQHFGGSELDVMLTNEIKSKDNSENFSRRLALIDLWTDGKEFYNLHPSIHTAFNLPAISTISHSPETQNSIQLSNETTLYNSSIENEPFPPSSLLTPYDAIGRWGNGDQLPSEVGQTLRTILFEAITQRIDWNSEFLLRKVTKNFDKARNITFVDSTRSSVAGIELHLPLPSDDRVEVASALQGILLYNHYKHWKFPKGSRYFRIYARQLEKWSQYVLDRIHKSLRKSEDIWNPVSAVVELLAIGSRMAGRRSDCDEALLNGLFKDFTDSELDISTRSSNWKKLFTNINKESRSNLLDILQARIACTKGSSTRLQIIDASQLLQPLKAIASDWTPKCDIPEDLRADYEVIRTVRLKIGELLAQAVNDERDRQLKIYEFMLQELGEDFSKDKVVETFKNAIKDAKDAGVAANVQNLETAIQEFEKLKIKAYMSNMKKIQDEENVGLLLESLSSTLYSQGTMGVIENFLKQARQFVDSSIKRAENNKADLPSSGDLESSYEAIESGIGSLKNLAVAIKGDTTSCS